MQCGEYVPLLYYSNSVQNDPAGTSNPAGCSTSIHAAITYADGPSPPNSSANIITTTFTPRENEGGAWSISTYECFALPSPEGGVVHATVECGDQSCFPADSRVTLSDGSSVRVDALKAGDSILVAARDGSLAYERVSMFSLSDSAASATFIALSLAPAQATHTKQRRLRLTPDHHVPTGAECCTVLSVAKDIQVGDTVWVADAAKGNAEAWRVYDIELDIAQGLYNPLSEAGGFPVVDGVVTSFNSIEVVMLDSIAVPWLEAMCSATGTCTALRRVVTAAECALKHARRAAWGSRDSGSPCKTFSYIDGVSCRAGSCWTTTAPKSAERDAHVPAAAGCRGSYAQML